MDYEKKVRTIKNLTSENRTTSVICDRLDIKPYQFYNICNREKITYNKKTKGGRTIGAMDKKPRTRKSKAKIKKGGTMKQIEQIEEIRVKQNEETEQQINEYDLHLRNAPTIRLHQPNEAERFIQEQEQLLQERLSELEYTYNNNKT